ncbi:proline--tRNA ligase [Candidatus Aerophobetes bacterium]|nr:proline--tRNA ligase [Candidatus Aerophobetes bacterium]
MRLSRYPIFTTKEIPRTTELISHQLMLKAGLIRNVSSGIYSYLPMGYRVLNKVISIVKEEMNKIGAEQVLLPFIQPADLWKRSNRWKNYGEELLRFQDRKGGWFVLSPTHEELITQLVKELVTSYKRLPLVLYQIQIKFRDEMRPRGGVIRSREFLMKDAYSFSQNEKEMKEIYQQMRSAYERIFSRCHLKYKLVEAESGSIGGNLSHEFIALSPMGEDKIVECDNCGYLAKLEMANYSSAKDNDNEEIKPIKEVPTPGVKTIKDLSEFLHYRTSKLLKTLFYQTDKGLIGAVIRGDHQVNEEKLKKLVGAKKIQLAGEDAVKKETGIDVGFIGPVGINSQLIVDTTVMEGKNFVAGSNQKDLHFLNVNPGRDFQPWLVGNIRFPSSEDRCPRCGHSLSIRRGIEVGHLFQLGKLYSHALKARFLNKEGREDYFIMGCYGIGISRLPATIIEQNYDGDGIIWPIEVAPFEVVVIPTNEKTVDTSEEIYLNLQRAGLEVLLDDRDVSVGVKFKDSDLIGIPFKVILGNTWLKEKKAEIKNRKNGKIEKVKLDQVPKKIMELITYAK